MKIKAHKAHVHRAHDQSRSYLSAITLHDFDECTSRSISAIQRYVIKVRSYIARYPVIGTVQSA